MALYFPSYYKMASLHCACTHTHVHTHKQTHEHICTHTHMHAQVRAHMSKHTSSLLQVHIGTCYNRSLGLSCVMLMNLL